MMTRPDIAFTVLAVVRFCELTELVHETFVFEVMQCLVHAREWRISYDWQGSGFNMEAYTASGF